MDVAVTGEPHACGESVLLELQNLRRTDSHGVPLLHDISWQLQEGERWTVRGRSGAGKTLLLRALAALDPFSGTLRFHGRELLPSATPAYRAEVIYVAQTPVFSPGTVDRAWREPFTWTANRERVFREELAAEWLRRVGRSIDFRRKPTSELSGGEASLAAVIQAVLLQPTVLLLDEPTAAMDPETALALESCLQEWVSRTGRAYVWVTHDEEQAARVSGRQLRLERGRAVDHE